MEQAKIQKTQALGFKASIAMLRKIHNMVERGDVEGLQKLLRDSQPFKTPVPEELEAKAFLSLQGAGLAIQTAVTIRNHASLARLDDVGSRETDSNLKLMESTRN